MSTYQTEEEQVEAIKKWWKENGRSVIGGVVLGFLVIGGWQGWQTYQRKQGEGASIAFDVMRHAVRTEQFDKALEDGKSIVGEYSGTAYASFAALELARLAYQRGEKSVARNQLQWVVDSAPDPVLRELGRLRLGHLLLDMKEYDALDKLLAVGPLQAFAGEFAVLRGDLMLARGDTDGARGAYLEALAAGVEDADLLRMKLVDVGGAPAAS
ncbi:MAG: tetratricopeptide repeat protein [Chromatiaceae bacterium]|nr:tetratricopeptide repeat protein [Gammaproteobacteria bacterium]MCP5301189.1 tetratricopeptide repeat protein [Chromatiaceae bacterium]MCP5421339.1 tetratricopeptide repeat protein [Chromatiaceae bacterium]